MEIEGPNHDFYFYDFARTVLSKVTTDGMSHDPVWSPDGKRLAFRSWQAGGMTMWLMPSDRSAARHSASIRQGRVKARCRSRPMESFSPSTRRIRRRRMTSWSCPSSGDRSPVAVAQSRFGEGSGKFSPDGRWIAYSSAESGQPEIYVQAFPGPGPKLQVSNEGGTDPVWRRDGGELYYRSDNKMMAVSVTTSPEFKAGAPRLLWEGPTRTERAPRAECPGSGPPITTSRPTASGF